MKAVRGEDGLTIVEVLVASVILVVGSLAVFSIVDAATKTSYRAEQSQVGSNLLQMEVEKIRALPYDRIAMTTSPGGSTNTSSPLNRVVGTRFRVNPETPGVLGDMVLQGGTVPGAGKVISNAEVNPGPSPFTVGDVAGNIYRIVVWQGDPACQPPACASLKRIIVIMDFDGTAQGGMRPYRELHSEVFDPETAVAG